MDPVATVETIWADMDRRLGHLGQVVIAGGAVRDSLLGRTPKDYDVFILRTNGYAEQADDVVGPMSGLTRIFDSPEAYGLSEDFVGAWYWMNTGLVIQVMFSSATSVTSLLESFDWNVAMFAYDSDGIHVHVDAPTIKYTAEGVAYFSEPLALTHFGPVRWPMSSLRRGVDFARRYHMKLRPGDIHRLADAIQRENLKRETNGC